MIAAEHLSANAGSFTLEDVSFRIAPGAWAVVLGAAGAGKTTLLETIAGIRAAAGGSVSLRDRDCTRMPPEQRHVGFVYQHAFLFPHLSVRDNIAYGRASEVNVLDVARRFEIGSLLDRGVNALSGGERQIVALARAIAPDPDIVLLDEPFAALDPRRRRNARSEVRAWQQERGATVMHVTHDFPEARTLGDMALVIQDGRLVQSGLVNEVFQSPATRELADFLDVDTP